MVYGLHWYESHFLLGFVLIWFFFIIILGFIFGSLVEFAFVNTIWRRKKNVELKKVNASNILKQTLTPRPTRRDVSSGHSPCSLQKSHSWSNIKDQEKDKSPLNGRTFKFDNNLTVHVSILFTLICYFIILKKNS